jgi:hypothetical protein
MNFIAPGQTQKPIVIYSAIVIDGQRLGEAHRRQDSRIRPTYLRLTMPPTSTTPAAEASTRRADEVSLPVGSLTSPCFLGGWVMSLVPRDADPPQRTVLRPHQAAAAACYRKRKFARLRSQNKKSRRLRLAGNCYRSWGGRYYGLAGDGKSLTRSSIRYNRHMCIGRR